MRAKRPGAKRLTGWTGFGAKRPGFGFMCFLIALLTWFHHRHLGPGYFFFFSILSIKCASTTYMNPFDMLRCEINAFMNYANFPNIYSIQDKNVKFVTLVKIPFQWCLIIRSCHFVCNIISQFMYSFLSNTQALGSRIFVFFNFINEMCIYNVYEPVWYASLWNIRLYERCPIFLISS